MNHPSSYKGQHVVVLGLAKSGVTAAKVFHHFGADVTVNDKKDRELCPEADELTALGISVLCGSHPSDLVTESTALLIKNPGIPYTAEPVKRALELGVEVVTEVETAYYLSSAPIIGITGSNGKTTTTTMIGELLVAAGLKPIVAGNIGRPLCEAAIEAEEDQWIVAELSSFQLKGTKAFRPHIGLLLNIAETHLDYHGDMDDYIASKLKMFDNQTAEDTAVLNWDYAECRKAASKLKARLLPFSLYERLATGGVYVDPPFDPNDHSAGYTVIEPSGQEIARRIVYCDTEGQVSEIISVSELGILGRHNTANALAAVAACIAAGALPEQLKQPLADFRSVEHRLEYVSEVNGVRYYNDTKATNPVATTMSVRALEGSIVLIAGGLDRGSDYMELLPLLQNNVKGLVVIGQTRSKLAHVAELAGLTTVISVEPEEDADRTLETAVREAAALAEPGDIVLLSPACASWDMFASYEQRGRIFKKSVHTL